MDSRAQRLGLTAKSVFFALLVHGLVAVLLMVHFTWDSGAVAESAASPETQPIQAMVVDQAEIDQRLADLEAEEERKRQQELEAKRKLKEAQTARELEEKRLAELERKRKEEEQKAAAAEKKRKLEQQKALAARKKREEEEAKALAEKKRRAEQQRRQEEEKKKKEEQLRLAKLEREKEEKRKAEELRKKKEAEERARREAEEKKLQAKLEAERREADRKARAQSALAGVIPAIRQAVSRNWIRPPNARPGLEATVLVTVTPTGEVISAKVTASSGDRIFDRSVENAILKASPLPIPKDRDLYEFFREFIFRFKPDQSLIS